jgi:hypothetical protein
MGCKWKMLERALLVSVGDFGLRKSTAGKGILRHVSEMTAVIQTLTVIRYAARRWGQRNSGIDFHRESTGSTVAGKTTVEIGRKVNGRFFPSVTRLWVVQDDI